MTLIERFVLSGWKYWNFWEESVEMVLSLRLREVNLPALSKRKTR